MAEVALPSAPHAYRHCPSCATLLQQVTLQEDGGPKERTRCPACGWTHWNNPTPVLAAVLELPDAGGRLLLARNAAWGAGMFGLVTGFMEAGETPEDGIRREVLEETGLVAESARLVGVYDFQRMNQVIIAYHVVARGDRIVLSPELAEYRLLAPEQVKCWPAGTGQAVADWLRSRGIEPQWLPVPGVRAVESGSTAADSPASPAVADRAGSAAGAGSGVGAAAAAAGAGAGAAHAAAVSSAATDRAPADAASAPAGLGTH